MTVTSWVAKHSGLPSFYGHDCTITTRDGRTLHEGGTGHVYLSDMLATPGIPTDYVVDGHPVSLTRDGQGARFGLITNEHGRTIPGLWLRDTGDGQDWASSVSLVNGRYATWPAWKVGRTGTASLISWDPDMITDLWDLLRAPGVKVFTPGGAVPGMAAPRAIVINSVESSRVSPTGAVQWTVKWTELPTVAVGHGRAPVITWGEYEKAYGTWTTGSLVDVLHDLAGMPA
ncbi:hypothetical protein [Actinobaculum sp. 352]|uniref:hypothetical protein n=1 Tax=Actinobaculum sp. 352 TaxID=2490946 RepID=UPI000F7E1935|nr:hypothetical protein [Actinobaculum sp. 352]RTE47888.1 hypothetical protein EKN07_11555 [Actinobaculum sp. 352]